MYKNSLHTSAKKNSLTFTKIKRVRRTMTYNIRTKYEFNHIHRLDVIVFTCIYTNTHTLMHHCKNSVNEFERSQIV